MPLLDREHRVVAVDLLGHGGSEKPDSGYSIPNQADLVAEALERLGVRHAEVVGHSLGGGVATALAERSPELVETVVIIDTRARTTTQATSACSPSSPSLLWSARRCGGSSPTSRSARASRSRSRPASTSPTPSSTT